MTHRPWIAPFNVYKNRGEMNNEPMCHLALNTLAGQDETIDGEKSLVV